jgi:hypothetical protein
MSAPGIMELRNPTNKRVLKTTPRTQHRVTRNNTPRVIFTPVAPATYTPIPSRAHQQIVTQHTINAFMCNKHKRLNLTFTPTLLLPPVVEPTPSHVKHFALPMVHPVTGETISSYKKLMNDPATSKAWQTAFGKDFGGMAQGNNKTGQKGTNAMFVMTHNEIKHVLRQNKTFMYGNSVVDYRPQKEDPNRIRITAGRNRVAYESSPSMHTADLATAKPHWNSIISMLGARYMCLDIIIFYLMARLEYYKYIQMLLSRFPKWIQIQYNMKQSAYKGCIHLEM